jgi:hypothetical protein
MSTDRPLDQRILPLDQRILRSPDFKAKYQHILDISFEELESLAKRDRDNMVDDDDKKLEFFLSTQRPTILYNYTQYRIQQISKADLDAFYSDVIAETKLYGVKRDGVAPGGNSYPSAEACARGLINLIENIANGAINTEFGLGQARGRGVP